MYRSIHRMISCIAILSILLTLLAFQSISAEQIEKISPVLLERMSEVKDNELIPVSVWTVDIDHNGIKEKAEENVQIIKNAVTQKDMSIKAALAKNLICSGDDIGELNDTQLYIEAKRKIYSDKYTQANKESLEKILPQDKLTNNAMMDNPTVTWISQYTPLVKLSLTKAEILEIEKKDIIEYIYLDKYEMIQPDPILVQPESAGNGTTPANIWQGTTNITYVRDTLGYTGSGIKVGLYDGGVLRYNDSAMVPYRSVFTTLQNSGRLIADPSAPTGDPSHAAFCGSLIAATDGSVRGVAPGVSLYSTTGGGRTGGMEGAYEWMISQGVNVISCSIGWSGYNEYGYISQWFDHIAIQHDITTVIAAGNSGSTGITGGGMSYNSITVGSNDDRNTISRTDDDVSDFSSYINDYSSSLPMKPDLVAPGDGIMTPLGPSGGTSLSCPEVAGVIALLYQIRPALTVNQALTKSILLSGIDDCGYLLMRSSYPGSNICAMWWDSGAGMLDAKAARYVAANNRYVGVTMGSGSTLYTKTFTVSASDTLTRVNLSWLKNNRLSGNHGSYNPPSNPSCAVLYLEVVAPNGTVYKSERNGGNVQNICFTPPVTGTYTIRVKKISAPSSEPNVYFGLSWY